MMGRRFEPLIAAEEAYPALERCVLDARHEVSAGFRVFDLSTRLRSSAARAVGDTWFDLVIHTLRRGVRMRFVISDFDPIGATELHEMSWRSFRQFAAAREIAGPDAGLIIIAGMHPARAGLLPRLAFAPKVRNELRKALDDLNAGPEALRDNRLKNLPALARIVTERRGKLAPKLFTLPPLYPVTHHQKLLVVDRRHVFIGGLDVDERRYDTKYHDRPAPRTWHDVQLLIDDPELGEKAAGHLDDFGMIVAARRPPPAADPYFLTTLSTRRRWNLFRLSPRTIRRELADKQIELAARTRHMIYFETQFFRDKRLARALMRAARRNPDLRMVLILPAAPEEVAFLNSSGMDQRFGEHLQAKCLRRMKRAFGNRLFIGSPVKHKASDSDGRGTLEHAPLIYVHAKVAIFDTDRAVVSSANLNGRSLNWDTEAGLFLDDPAEVAELRRRVFRHWLPADADDSFFDAETAALAWARLARENAERAPQDRRGFIVPYDVASAEVFGAPVPVLPDEIV